MAHRWHAPGFVGIVSEYEAGRCVIGEKVHSASHGHLCQRHLEQAGTMLREIEDQAAMLTAVPSMAIRNGSRGGSPAFERAPARLDVLVHTDPRHGTGRSEEEDDELAAGETLSILNTLYSWARVVREERDLSPVLPITITGERDTLTRNLEWVAEQDWVDEFHADIRKLAGQLKAQNGTAPEKPVGRCYVLTDGVECSGPIWIDSAMGHAHCGRCRATWDGHEIARLQIQLELDRRPKGDDGHPMQTAEEIAEKKGMTVNAVRLKLSRNGWRAIGGYYDAAWLTRRTDMAS